MTDRDGSRTRLSPDAAIDALSNEQRLRILEALGGVKQPVSFSELQERAGIAHSGQFNYHLEKLVGQYIRKRNDGYVLRQPGQRVLEAIHAGTLTEDPVIEPIALDMSCPLCETPLRMSYGQERVELYCPGCPGFYGPSEKRRESTRPEAGGIIGGFRFPPTGVTDRSPSEILEASSIWGNVEMIAAARGICPRCAARIDHDVRVCAEHRTESGLCSQCDRRNAVQIRATCQNCLYSVDSFFLNYLLGSETLRCFVAEQGVDVLSSALRWGWDYEEEIHSIEPFSATFTIRIDGEALSLTVDDSLSIVETQRANTSESY